MRKTVLKQRQHTAKPLAQGSPANLILSTNKTIDKNSHITHTCKDYTRFFVQFLIDAEYKNADNTAYEHCELSVNGEGFLALAEAKNPCDIDTAQRS